MKNSFFAMVMALCLVSPIARGGFVLFENFSSYTNAPLVGQGPAGNTWQLTGGDTNLFVVTNYSGVNLAWCLAAPGNSGAWRSLAPAGLAITNGSPAATVFFEFAYFNPIPGSSPTYNQWNFIVTDRLPVNTAGSSEVQFNWDSTQVSPGGGVSTFRIRNGGAFVFASTTGTAAGDVPVGIQYIATTYKVWFLINKATSTYQVYMQNDAIPSLSGSPQQIFADNGSGGTFNFRNGASLLDLTNINLGCTPTGQAGTVVYDNIYVDTTGFNLTSPAGNIPIQPPPQTPPTVSLSTKKVTGLNIITGSAGNTFYDRQQVRLTNTVGKAWVGHATAGNPVSYSYTIKGFDSASYGSAPNFAAEYAYLYLIPNGGIANTPDYNSDSACQVFVMKTSPTNAVLQFQYKVNLPNGNDMFYGRGLYTNAPGSWDGVTAPWYESGQIGGVTNFAASNPAVGTWTVQFTSDTNVTLIAPNGNKASYVIPPYNIGPFAADDNFGIYLGNMAQNQQGLNQTIVYSRFSAAGVPSPYTDNFTNDSVLSPEWDPNTSSSSSCVFLLPSTAAYLASWTAANGGHWLLQGGSDLLQSTNWTSPSFYPQINGIGQVQQYIDQSELPGPIGFYNLKKIDFTQLQILLPGETNAPGTLTGKVGTPLPVSLGAGGFVNVTVNAVDATFHIIPGVTDIIKLTSDDNTSFLPNNASLVNGTLTFGVTGNSQPLAFGSPGTWTITASDVSVFSSNILPTTSSPVNVTP